MPGILLKSNMLLYLLTGENSKYFHAALSYQALETYTYCSVKCGRKTKKNGAICIILSQIYFYSLKKQFFDRPVVIETLELLRLDNSFLCRVRSRDGAEGISVAHSDMRTLFPIFLRNLQPFFIGKDARELDLILEKVIYNQLPIGGIARPAPGHHRVAILDMLGRMAKPWAN
jgi:hypothetical protein